MIFEITLAGQSVFLEMLASGRGQGDGGQTLPRQRFALGQFRSDFRHVSLPSRKLLVGGRGIRLFHPHARFSKPLPSRSAQSRIFSLDWHPHFGDVGIWKKRRRRRLFFQKRIPFRRRLFGYQKINRRKGAGGWRANSAQAAICARAMSPRS